MAGEQSAATLLPLIVRRLAGRPNVALARIWLVRPGDQCATCPARPECPDQTTCLHLVASAGRPLHEEGDWSRLDGPNRRIPLGVRKVGLIAARGQPIEVANLEPDAPWLASPEWVRREGIRGFGGEPLIHGGRVVGVLAVFFRTQAVGEVLMWLRLIADRAAAAVASESGVQSANVTSQQSARLARAFRFPPAVFPELPGYEILGEAGRGGSGVVYKARQLSLQRLVAIKVVPLGLDREDQIISRFHQERLLVALVTHPNLVAAYDAGEIAGLPYFVMEFVEGTGLDALVSQRGPLPVAEACEVVRQAALGLQHLHEHGLVHRDVKPSNLMLTPSGQVKVIDLGLARVVSGSAQEGQISLPGQFLGTLDYMAPEQSDDCHTVDIRARHLQPGLHALPPAGRGPAVRRLLVPVPRSSRPMRRRRRRRSGSSDPTSRSGWPGFWNGCWRRTVTVGMPLLRRVARLCFHLPKARAYRDFSAAIPGIGRPLNRFALGASRRLRRGRRRPRLGAQLAARVQVDFLPSSLTWAGIFTARTCVLPANGIHKNGERRSAVRLGHCPKRGQTPGPLHPVGGQSPFLGNTVSLENGRPDGARFCG